MRKITVIIALFLAAIQIVSAQKVGLVLSGGGAKGAAHIGVIKALEENNIPIDYITGTSIGAIIGSLYAMGYSPEEMLELMLSKEFAYWQTGTVEEQYTYYFKEPYPTPEFAHFSIDMSDSLQIKASFLPQSLINPIQMNQAFMALFSQATAKAGWNFDNLFVPFRCVASDIYTKKPIIFKNGDLGDAVRASMTDSIKQRVPREVPLNEVTERRKAYKENLPSLIFRNIYVTGVSEAQRKYIEAQLHRDINNEFSMEEFKRAYFKMLTYSKIREIMPHAVYNRKEKKFDLYLDVKMKEEITVGFGGNVSSHQANQLYLGLGYQYLGRFAADVNSNFQVGNSFSGVMLSGRMYLQTQIPTYLNWQGVFSDKKYTESQSLFYEDIVPAMIKQKELYMKLKLGFPFLNHAKAEIGFAYGRLNDFYLQSTTIPFPNASFDHSWYDLFSGSLSIEQNSLNAKQYPISGKQQFLIAQYVTGTEKYTPSPTSATTEAPIGRKVHSWLQLKGRWNQYQTLSNRFNLGYLAEMVISSKNLMNNYTASVLQAPAFTPTPHSEIVFNEAFRANQYVAFGLSPILKLSKLLHFRLDMYGFAPLYEIQKTVPENNPYVGIPHYGKFLHSFNYMGEAAVVLQLPFLCISLYANGYSYPKENFNFGLNIGYLIFNPKMLD